MRTVRTIAGALVALLGLSAALVALPPTASADPPEGGTTVSD